MIPAPFEYELATSVENAIELLGHIARTFGVRLAPSDFNATPTLAALADRIRVAASKASQEGSTLPFERVLEYASVSPESASANVSAGTAKLKTLSSVAD